MVDYFGKKAKLHAIWDTNIITDILANNYSSDQYAWGNDLLVRQSYSNATVVTHGDGHSR
jgi:hypothetical protein